MKNELKWSYDPGYHPFFEKKFRLDCKVFDNNSIESFYLSIEQRNGALRYSFEVTTKSKHNQKTTESYLKSNLPTVDLHHCCDSEAQLGICDSSRNKEMVTSLMQVFLKMLHMNEEDKEAIFTFLQEGILSEENIFGIIVNLILASKVQEAFDKALLAEQQGYQGILYKVADVFLQRKLFQPAYVAFGNVKQSDANYINAQTAAAKIAAMPQITFNDPKERLKTIFIHCQNTGERGQSVIDYNFNNLAGLQDSVLQVKNVQTNFETLSNLADIIAKQNGIIKNLNSMNPDTIVHQNEEIERLNSTISKQSEENKRLHSSLMEQDEKVKFLNSNAVVQNENIKRFKATVIEKDEEIENFIRVVSNQADEIKNLNSIIVEQNEKIESLNSKLEKEKKSNNNFVFFPAPNMPNKITIPKNYFCMITQEVMKNPLFCTLDNRTYEAESIKEWLLKNGTAPSDRTPLNGSDIDTVLFKNLDMKQLIEDFRQAHPDLFDENGDEKIVINPTSSPKV